MSDIDSLTVSSIQEQERKDTKPSASDQKNWTRLQQQYSKNQHELTKQHLKNEEKAKHDAEDVLKAAILQKIKRYFEAFPFLEQKMPKITTRCTLAEAEKYLDLIRQEMDSQRSLLQLHKYTTFGFTMLGNMWGDGSKMTMLHPNLRLNLSGIEKYYATGIFRNELEPLLVEIDIEYPWIGRQTLFVRILETIGEVMVKVHTINTHPEARRALNLETEAPADIPE